MRMVLLFPLAVLPIVGCTHTQLKINTTATSRTWSEIQYQQVADNLAMLGYNSEMLPYFIVIGQGTVEVADSVGLDGELEWEPSAKAKRVLGLDLGRETKAEWELRPVTQPLRLDWMRTAYLCALEIEGYKWDEEPCAGYLKEFEVWYGLDKGQGQFGPFEPQPWPVQILADAMVVGRYRDTVVIVRNDQMKDLRLLTTLILEYATLKYEKLELEEEASKRQKQMRPIEDFYNPNLRGTGG